MLTTIEAIVENDGRIRCLQGVEMAPSQRVLVTILPTPDAAHETALLSEPALAKDWLSAEEESAWQHPEDRNDLLRSGRSGPSPSTGSPA